jgi:hypothetical protein
MAKMSNRREHYESFAHFPGAFTEEMCNAPCAHYKTAELAKQQVYS